MSPVPEASQHCVLGSHFTLMVYFEMRVAPPTVFLAFLCPHSPGHGWALWLPHPTLPTRWRSTSAASGRSWTASERSATTSSWSATRSTLSGRSHGGSWRRRRPRRSRGRRLFMVFTWKREGSSPQGKSSSCRCIRRRERLHCRRWVRSLGPGCP